MPKPRRYLPIVAAVIALTATAWWWRGAAQLQSRVVAALPPVPDLTAAPGELTDEVQAAQARADSLLHARDGLAQLSRLYHANGFLDEASQCYRALEQLEPNNPRWPHLHATILAGFGEIEPAQKLWRRVIQLAPNYVPARLRLGDTYLKSNRPAEAAAAYTAVLKQEPDNAYALLGLGRLDFEAQRWDQARERLEKVVQLTNYQLGYDLIVSLYERLGQRDRATAIRASAKASGAYRDPPDPWLDGLADFCLDPFRLSLSAGVAARIGEVPTALRLLKRAIELAPNDVSVRFQLGCLAVQQHNAALAREQLERCTALAPDFADGWAWLSTLYTDLGDAAAAGRTLATGLKNCPQSPGLHLMRARKWRDSGQADAAANEFLISINLRPNEPDAYIELANLYIGAGRTDEGVAQLRQALVAEPDNPAALGTLAFHAITTGSEAEARRWLVRVGRQPRVSPEVVARLHSAYRETFGHDYAPAP